MCKFDHSICVGLGKFWPQFALFTERFMHSTKILRERQSHRSQQISWLNTFKERKHDLNNKKTTTKTNTKAMTNAFREHLQCAIFETCDLWDICSDKTWLGWGWDGIDCGHWCCHRSKNYSMDHRLPYSALQLRGWQGLLQWRIPSTAASLTPMRQEPPFNEHKYRLLAR